MNISLIRNTWLFLAGIAAAARRVFPRRRCCDCGPGSLLAPADPRAGGVEQDDEIGMFFHFDIPVFTAGGGGNGDD